MNHSIWSSTVEMDSFPKLEGNIKTEVLVIGGGIAGILTAYYLKNAGVNTVLVEGRRIFNGVTANTTAKITSQHGLIYQKLLSSLGPERAGMYLDINQLALKKYQELQEKFPCDFESKNAFIYSLTDRTTIENEISAVKQLGFLGVFHDQISLPIKIAGAIEFKNQGQFHPLKLLKGLVKELNIYENTFVRKIENHTAYTDHGKIIAKHIIVATHFPFLNTHGSYFLKMYQHRSYIIGIKNGMEVNGTFLEEKEDGLSFRNYQDYLLIGGGDHRTGKQGGNFDVIRAFAKRHFPKGEEVYGFATQDCMTLDGMPYIGRYSMNTNHMYVATGFNKWGMTSSMVSAMILSDLILGNTNVYADLFSPSRSMIKLQLLKNTGHAIGNLAKFSTKRCPHMGCTLSWNSAEHTWDCPCHGSRFEKDGLLLDNPAMKNLKLK